jgi:hypothetical protein
VKAFVHVVADCYPPSTIARCNVCIATNTRFAHQRAMTAINGRASISRCEQSISRATTSMTEVKVPRITRFGSSTMPASTRHPTIMSATASTIPTRPGRNCSVLSRLAPVATRRARPGPSDHAICMMPITMRAAGESDDGGGLLKRIGCDGIGCGGNCVVHHTLGKICLPPHAP